MATLTYAYADRAVVMGPLATYAEPHSYDLCSDHASRMTVPQGWEYVRLDSDGYAPAPEVDDLVAVVEAVRERPAEPPTVASAVVSSMPPNASGPVPGEHRRGHLRMLPGTGPGNVDA
ncbi:hypothetical protein N802_18565 [Knoellia sinensis KCTC 19936]|uniref:DUF3499 domain-containing protein n=1 Tax=Knoellia sinensis KCTC 19936 TaxID=1385520 RepID=A0A0A0J6G1_9MICO|nr:hypothetical protein N802_18565 [Knoellia sinensis KCTC 19936]